MRKMDLCCEEAEERAEDKAQPWDEVRLSLLGLLEQHCHGRVAQTAEINHLTVLGSRHPKLRCRQGEFFLRI